MSCSYAATNPDDMPRQASRTPPMKPILQNLVEMTGHRDHLRLEVSVLSTLQKLSSIIEVRALELFTDAGVPYVRPRTWVEDGQLVSTDSEAAADPRRETLDQYPALRVCVEDHTDSALASPRKGRYVLWLPVWMHDKVSTCLEITQSRPFSAHKLDVLMGVFQVYQNYQSLLDYSERDALTGLFNRRHFAAEATAELARAHRTHSPSSILIADIDFFKKVNDQYGHPAGDQVLKEVANVLASNVRATDVVARLGGEEFIVLMPHTTRDGAMALAEKLRSSMDKHPMQVEAQTLAVTVSVGVSELAADQDGSFEDLYIAADTALYAAKSHGRNRVEWAPFRLREGNDTQV